MRGSIVGNDPGLSRWRRAGLLRIAGAALLLAALTACQYTPIASLIALSRFDFNTTDPSSFRAALTLPKAIVPQRVALRLVTAIDGGPERRDDLPLERFDDLAIAEVLPKGDAAGSETGTYRLSAADAAKFSAHRAWMLQQKAQGKRGSVKMEVLPESCLATPLAPGPVLATAYIKTSETGRYVPLARDFDLRTVDPKRDLVATAPPCSGQDAKASSQTATGQRN